MGRQGKHRFILTIMGRELSAEQIFAAADVIKEQKLNIDAIRRLTGRVSIMHPSKNNRSCIEFSLRGDPQDRQQMQSELMKLSADMGFDFSLQKG